jgi:hypothetical protein
MPKLTIPILSRKILANDVVTIRGARGGEDAPLILSIPRAIVNAARCVKGGRWQIYTDGEKIYLERLAEPKM